MRWKWLVVVLLVGMGVVGMGRTREALAVTCGGTCAANCGQGYGNERCNSNTKEICTDDGYGNCSWVSLGVCSGGYECTCDTTNGAHCVLAPTSTPACLGRYETCVVSGDCCSPYSCIFDGIDKFCDNCGGNGQYCCPGSVCDGGYECQDYTCVPVAPTNTPTPACECSGSSTQCSGGQLRTCDGCHWGAYGYCLTKMCASGTACYACEEPNLPRDNTGGTYGGSCSGANVYCEKECNAESVCPNDSRTGYKDVKCWTTLDCKNALYGICSRSGQWWDSGACPLYIGCPQPTVPAGSPTLTPYPTALPTPTSQCQPYMCVNVDPGGICPYATPAVGICSPPTYTEASCDNCGGPSCSWCAGAPTPPPGTPVPTTTPCNCYGGANPTTAAGYCPNQTFSCDNDPGNGINCYGTKTSGTCVCGFQGRKVIMPAGYPDGQVTPGIGQTVTVSGIGSAGSNPYSVGVGTNTGDYSASVSVPNGYMASYSYCANSTSCHTSAITPGASGTFLCPTGVSGNQGYADLYWHFDPPKTCTVSLTGSTAVAEGTSVAISFSGNDYSAAGDTLTNYVAKATPGQTIPSFTYIYNGNTYGNGTTVVWSGVSYYDLTQLNCNSTGYNQCSRSGSMLLPTGKYYIHCSLPGSPADNSSKKTCSGNKFCTYEGGPYNCGSSWVSCSSSDNAYLCVYPSGDCIPACGQTTTCSSTCSSDDTGAPGQVTPVSPRGSVANPTPFSSNNNIGLNWTNGESDHAKTDIYQYHLTDLDGGASPTPTTAWVASSVTGVLVNVGAQTSGHTYEWHSRAVNNTCDTVGVMQTYYGTWSSWGYFCYEGETCSLACGQSRDCDGSTACANTENAVPGQVTPVAPNGTSSSPTVLNDVTGAPLSWNINEANHAYTDHYNYQVLRNYGTGVTDYNGLTVNESVGSTTAVGALGRAYRWMTRARNDTCYDALGMSVIYGVGSSWGYYVLNDSPTLPTVSLTNESMVAIPFEIYGAGQTGNQICDQQITNRRIRLVVTATDIGVSGGVVGGASIDRISVRLRRSGVDYVTVTGDNLGSTPTYTLTGSGASFYTTSSTSVAGNNRTVVFPVQLGNVGTEGMLDIQLYAEDVYGANSGWVDSGRDLKVWDCEVSVSGSVYDSSHQGATVCPNIGYSDMYSGSSFTSLIYMGLAGAPSVAMTLLPPGSYQSPVGVGLSWGRGYVADINDDIDMSNPEFGTRVVDTGNLGGGTTTCEATGTFTLNEALVSAYSDSPTLLVDFSGIRDQEPWYQAMAGGINAGSQITDNVPMTCHLDRAGGGSCRDAMTWEMSGIGSSNNGLVVADSIDNNSGCGFDCGFGWPNDWSRTPGILTDKPGYEYFYNQYFVKYGEGTTMSGLTTMSNIINLTGGTGVVLVNGDVTVDVNNTVSFMKFLMVAASGRIMVNESVSGVQGVFVANGNIEATGDSASQLVVEGNLYSAGGNVMLTRSYVPKSGNNTSPPIVVEYRPDFIFSMPPNLARTKAESVWIEGR